MKGHPLKNVNFALQGGGAHGAFVWGVLDRLLEDGRLEIEAISATSAGAMNAVALASGMAAGGPKGARQKLEVFWAEVCLALRWPTGTVGEQPQPLPQLARIDGMVYA